MARKSTIDWVAVLRIVNAMTLASIVVAGLYLLGERLSDEYQKQARLSREISEEYA